ncbi:hypothetical protein N7494_012037 [Penicillium frequentans]|uniref:NACHT domain-containing protein n=1 Tax=Penicillium frequentans TaxID=3151616 RepID=A0AAD6CKV4_9EURO|nr:hypothetical protein N7494_012037 [Penicillium glabrum]
MESNTPFNDMNSGSPTAVNNGILNAKPKPATLLPEQIEISANKDCLRDLRTTDPREDKQRIEELSGGLLKEVYIWILDNVYFKRWRYERQGQLLRISGAPGQGKTMLVCGIINELINDTSETSMKPAAKTPILSFFFCQANDTRTNTANAVLRGLIFMLVDQRPSLISHIRQYYDKRGKQLFQDPYAWETISQILISILQDPRLQLYTTYFIIDALDECTTGRDRLLELIARLQSAYPQSKWIVSSRSTPDIEKAFSVTTQTIQLVLQPNEAIAIFTGLKVRELAKKKGYPDALRDEVSQYLSSLAHGNFLYVVFAYEKLSRVLDLKSVRATLQKIPSGLASIYTDILDEINCSKKAEVCNSLLSVIVTINRPITVDELASCIDIPETGADEREHLAEAIRMCGHFLVLRGFAVSLIHQTVKEFLGFPGALVPDHSGTPTSMGKLANTYLSQERCEEAEDIRVQIMEVHKQIIRPESPDTLGLLAEAVAHNTQSPPDLESHDDSEDSDLSIDMTTDNESVFSLAYNPSTSSWGPGSREINLFLVQEFATLLHENEILLSLISVGVSKQQIGKERMLINFRRLLQLFANDLKAEILEDLHRDLRSFVSSYSDRITRELFVMTDVDEKPNIKPPVPETERGLASIANHSIQERRVEDYIRSLNPGRPLPTQQSLLQKVTKSP